MESIFLYCIIYLLAGIPAILRPASRLTASQAYVRVPEGERIVSGQQPGANGPVIQKIFRPTARNGVRRQLPNWKAGAEIKYFPEKPSNE